MQLPRMLTLITALSISTCAYAQDYKIGNLHINHPMARASFPGATSSAAYVSMTNTGKSGDKLIAVTSPLVKSSQLHTMSMDGDVMKMREVDFIELKPASKIVMQPGHGYHIMLMGLKQPLKLGEKFPLTLTFEKAGKLEVSVAVEEIKPMKDMMNKDEASHTHK